MIQKNRKLLACCSRLLCVLLASLTLNIVHASEYGSDFIESELTRTKSNPDNSTTLNVEQPIELVFDALLTRLAAYSEDVASIDFDHQSSINAGTLGVGSERITVMNNGKRLVQRIILFEPPQEFAYFTDMDKSTVSVPIDYSIGHYSFSEDRNGGVSAEVSVVYQPSSRLTAFLVRIGFSRALSRDFKEAEEYLNSLPREN